MHAWYEKKDGGFKKRGILQPIKPGLPTRRSGRKSFTFDVRLEESK